MKFKFIGLLSLVSGSILLNSPVLSMEENEGKKGIVPQNFFLSKKKRQELDIEFALVGITVVPDNIVVTEELCRMYGGRIIRESDATPKLLEQERKKEREREREREKVKQLSLPPFEYTEFTIEDSSEEAAEELKDWRLSSSMEKNEEKKSVIPQNFSLSREEEQELETEFSILGITVVPDETHVTEELCRLYGGVLLRESDATPELLEQERKKEREREREKEKLKQLSPLPNYEYNLPIDKDVGDMQRETLNYFFPSNNDNKDK